MHAVLAHEALYVFIGGQPPTREELRARYERLARGSASASSETWVNLIVRMRDTGRAVGTVQATILGQGEERRAKVAWVIGVDWQGEGFATEAARALLAQLGLEGVHSIEASIHPSHVASQRVAANIGLSLTHELDAGEQVWRST